MWKTKTNGFLFYFILLRFLGFSFYSSLLYFSSSSSTLFFFFLGPFKFLGFLFLYFSTLFLFFLLNSSLLLLPARLCRYHHTALSSSPPPPPHPAVSTIGDTSPCLFHYCRLHLRFFLANPKTAQ